MPHSFRHSASFGKRIEFYVIGLMLKEGLDCYIPLVDDNAIDVIIKKEDGTFIEVQIKARSNQVRAGDSALFAALTHAIERKNYYFVFYSERLNKTWIMSSAEFLKESVTNKTGKNIGKKSIWLNGKKAEVEYAFEKYAKYEDATFKRFKE